MSTRRTLTVIMSRTISRTSETTSKTSGPSDVVPSIPRRTNQQQHRDNVPAQTPSDYYKRAVAIPILDHLQSEMKTYFNPTNDAVLSSLFNLLPKLVAVGDRNPDIQAALEFYGNDLIHHISSCG
ncbi:unnamed protein product [Porites evermanni]|uniref:Uncharacterized protein n=1 Tax=Porites evermanni TaxID=104178 RepID=A0ABN8M5A7_9CNID|nr:unnamed protein product [Porites evermanni]